ncbi:MAG: hypothetical protein AB7U83_16760 [Vicinamibacterales bacterium]
MSGRTRRWLPIVAGVAVLLVFVAIGAIAVSVAYVSEHTTVERDIDETRAAAVFAEMTGRFRDARPVIAFDADRKPRYVEGIAGRDNPGTVTTVHVLAWDPDDRALASVALPMWLLRLKSGPIEFGTYVSGLNTHGVQLDVADLERYGPGVLFDYQAPSGERVLLSAQ